MTEGDTAVLIPLHRSAPFISVVEGNIARLVTTSKVIVSDVTEEDDTLSILAAKWRGHPRVDFQGKRDVAAGWVAHYNDLLRGCSERYFMWLAHDDEIGPEYVRRCREELELDASLTGAFGRLLPVKDSGLEQVESLDPSATEIGGTPAAAVAAVREWNPGIAFRSLFRRSAVDIIRPLSHEHQWADLVWVFGLLSVGVLRHVPDVEYRKRWYATSTHREWPVDTRAQILAPMLAAELAWRAGYLAVHNEIGDIVEWASQRARLQLDDIERLRKELAAAQTHLSNMVSEMEQVRSECASIAKKLDTANRDLVGIRSSRSWRLSRRIARWAAWLPLGVRR